MKKILIIVLGLIFNYSISQNLTSTENYVYKKTHLSDPSDPVQKQLETVQYLDGLGRLKQIISIKSTPTGQDLVIPVVYDQFGRKTKDYLPIPVSTSNAAIQNSVSESTINSYYGVTNAFSEKELESSPLSRIFQSASPGEDWKMSSGHTVKYGYDANSITDQVKKYQITTTWDSANQMYTSSPSQIIYYEENSLYKFTIKDEDNNEKIVFKDLYGHIVLIRRNDGTNNLDTYYVYDKYDQLTYVIPPLASVESVLSQAILDNLCYQYRFDNKKRAVEKKFPGKGWEYMVYDKQDRLVAIQDANLKIQNRWLYTKYDQFSRVIMTGICMGMGTNRIDEHDYVNTKGNNNESRSSFVTINYSGMDVYYSVTQGYPQYDKVYNFLSLNYYDTYPEGSPVIPTQVLGQNVMSQDAQNSNMSTKTLPTANYIKNTEANDFRWTKHYFYYDTKGRAISTHSINYLGGYTKTETKLDFSGIALQNNTYHKRLITDVEKVITETFTYDNQNRLLTHKHKVDNNPEEILSQNTYNELSQLISKKVGSTVGSANPLQTIDYAYNIRGWLTKINDPVNLNGKLFGYQLRYQNPEPNQLGIDEAKYNGNISEVDWKMATDGILKRYSYKYDRLNRLVHGISFQPQATIPNDDYFEYPEYDRNGNIVSLIRGGKTAASPVTTTTFDELRYSYEGNRLVKIVDSQNNTSGYPGGGNLITYDGNGNMTSMMDKRIKEISYNFLNLPSSITLLEGSGKSQKVQNIYQSDGTRLSKKYTKGTTIITTDYLDNFQYENSTLQPTAPDLKFASTAEGYYSFENNKYIYQYKDQVGNVRISFYKDANGNPVIDNATDFYPFGLEHHDGAASISITPSYKYKYQGQELQETGFYSFKWRNYMPDVGRFFNVDPLSEIYAYQSHYNFSENRVIDALEIEGLEAEIINKENEWASFEGRPYDGGLESITTYTDGTKEANIKTVELESSYKTPNDSGFGWGDAARVGVSFVPFVGSGLDIYEGARDGNWLQFGFGIGGMALDIVTLGSGSIVKGGVKTIGTHLVEEGMEKATKELAKNASKEIGSSGGGEILSMNVERIISHGEKIDDLTNEIKGMTWLTGNEHAIVRLASGEKAIISGGSGGISFRPKQIKTLFGHTHPTSAGPSSADFNFLRKYEFSGSKKLGQSRQYILHGGETTLIRP
ncbi:DUF6443 domain-containing protein [Chryseobacterium defluvii]|uniref:RHS repeat-associated protein n=1 Tax=Chryseobacterium defluvii TaxID=160396 RepID=A0A495SML5_9FLAO|nr:DUF6443 domain-containing protein [Chryseobacterium defluvii]RKT01463.1 RHS repeat-associated protein [Chryseobacterium defluvii]